jgi:DNA-binding transcriptional MerR regulator
MVDQKKRSSALIEKPSPHSLEAVIEESDRRQKPSPHSLEAVIEESDRRQKPSPHSLEAVIEESDRRQKRSSDSLEAVIEESDRRQKRSSDSLLDLMGIREAQLTRFGTGEVAEILGVPMWRLHKFLSPQYQLSSTEQLGGKGHGSRRVFTVDDVYRIAIAGRLNGDGFAPKFIGEIMAELKDHKLIDRDDQGEEVVWGIALSRGPKQVELSFFRSGNPPDMKVWGRVYYALDCFEIMGQVNAGISKLAARR